jgi:hypothetical protein
MKLSRLEWQILFLAFMLGEKRVRRETSYSELTHGFSIWISPSDHNLEAALHALQAKGLVELMMSGESILATRATTQGIKTLDGMPMRYLLNLHLPDDL